MSCTILGDFSTAAEATPTLLNVSINFVCWYVAQSKVWELGSELISNSQPTMTKCNRRGGANWHAKFSPPTGRRQWKRCRPSKNRLKLRWGSIVEPFDILHNSHYLALQRTSSSTPAPYLANPLVSLPLLQLRARAGYYPGTLLLTTLHQHHPDQLSVDSTLPGSGSHHEPQSQPQLRPASETAQGPGPHRPPRELRVQ